MNAVKGKPNRGSISSLSKQSHSSGIVLFSTLLSLILLLVILAAIQSNSAINLKIIGRLQTEIHQAQSEDNLPERLRRALLHKSDWIPSANPGHLDFSHFSLPQLGSTV